MKATEDQVEAAYDAMAVAIADEVLSGSKMPQDAFLRKLARIGLEAVPEVELLGELLNSVWPDMYVEEIAKNPPVTSESGWQAVVICNSFMFFGVAEEPEDAVRKAVAIAKASVS